MLLPLSELLLSTARQLDFGAGVEQPFNGLIVQNRQACSPWGGRWIGHWWT